CMQALDFPRTF
nr:immunoglobulin light chain junction region [Macaca mulatta]MOX10047.1 immunoglobulin light chain junction region [Macaca mulatta]